MSYRGKPESRRTAPLSRTDLAETPVADHLFDADWYTHAHPDVAESGLTPWRHFVLHGDLENFPPNPHFDVEFYRRTYMQLETPGAGVHYILEGRARGYLTAPTSLSPRQSSRAMRAAVAYRRYPFVVIGHDAQRAGAPLLLLEIARHLRARGFAPIFILQRGGPILDRYRALGPTFLLAEGWDVAALGEGLRPGTPSLGSTAWSASVLRDMALQSPRVVAVHEMLDYLRAHDLVQPIADVGTAVASFPRQVADLRAVLPAATSVTQVRPALIRSRTRSWAHREVDQLLIRTWGKHRTVFLGAGFADQRKGFDLFLAAARRIHSQRPDARFVWLGERAGWGRDLADAAVASGLPLLMPGFVADAAAWYAQAAVYLLTSRQDPGPTTVMDAARTGVPFVAYQADLGLQDYAVELAGVGSFVSTDAEFDARALALAADDTAARRRTRARTVAALTNFRTYVTELLRAVDPGRVAEVPPKVTQVAHTAARATRPAVKRVLGEAYDTAVAAARALGLPATWRPRRALRLAHWTQGTRRAQITVAVRDDATALTGGAPAGALSTPAEVQSLRVGERVWLADVALLEYLPRRAIVHLGRSDGGGSTGDVAASESAVVAAVEAGSHAIAHLHQYPASALPRWMDEGAVPPRRGSRTAGRRRSDPGSGETRVGTVTGAGTVGVFAHIYYPELAETLAGHIRRIPRRIALYVSTDSETKAEQIRVLLPEADVRVFSNRGRDLFPKLYGFDDAYAQHEIVLHLHTKRSPHLPEPGGWLEHILEALLPSSAGIEAILRRFDSQPRLGMVSPTPYGPIASSYGWTVNRPIAEALTFSRGWRLPRGRRLHFPAGSMFWARTAALAPVRSLDLSIDMFADDAPLRDGSVAHALERLIGVSCGIAGFRQTFVAPARRRPR